MKFTNWLYTFLTEKGIYQDMNSDLLFGEKTEFLPEQQDAQDKHFIQLDFFIEFMEQLPAHIQKSIKTTFVKMDFHNADCRDYLKHLINGMFKAQGYEPVYIVKFT